MTLIARVCAICSRVLHQSQAGCPDHATAPAVNYAMARSPRVMPVRTGQRKKTP